MKKSKKYYKLIIIFLIVLMFFLLSLFAYEILFKEHVNDRLNGIENYTLTNEEISLVKQKFNELEVVKEVNVYLNYKIIKIFVDLSEDVEFNKVKEISNQIIEIFSEKNVSFYDIEIFINSQNSESEIYPKIGYKHKTNLEFTWNR